MRNLQPTEDVASGFQQGSSSIHYTWSPSTTPGTVLTPPRGITENLPLSFLDLEVNIVHTDTILVQTHVTFQSVCCLWE